MIDSSEINASALPINDRILIPALRRRKEDLELLINYFLVDFCRQVGKELRELSHDTLRILSQYDWPGNIGELKGVIEALVYRSKPPSIDPSMLPAHLVNPLCRGIVQITVRRSADRSPKLSFQLFGSISEILNQQALRINSIFSLAVRVICTLQQSFSQKARYGFPNWCSRIRRNANCKS